MRRLLTLPERSGSLTISKNCARSTHSGRLIKI